MKKFGIRALACSLAVMMVAGLGAPAVASAEEDILLISPAPTKVEKVLHITEDMVDEDGEIVISGGTYDRVIVSKEAAAKNIYFDQVTVGELVVEGGNKANVQLWEVDAEKLTVQEPELENLSLFDLLPLLQDPETQQTALEMYKQSRAKDNYALNVAPTIVTMDDAKVDELVTRTNVKLDLGAGEVGEVALEASAKQSRVDVTLSNYEGNVSYKGGDEFSSVTLRNVDSRIKNLKVEESSAENYFSVTAKNSVVMRAEVAGNANVALNAPMGVVEVTEEATAANVKILNVAEELNVAGDGAVVELTMNANVTFATVTSDNVKIGGSGSLIEADLQGKGAYVSTDNTEVEGENTYIKPVYVERPEDIEWSFGSFAPAGWGYTSLGYEDSGAKFSLISGWSGEVYYVLPKAIDACYYKEAIIKVKTASENDTVTVKLTHEGADKDSYGNPVPFFSQNVTGEAEVVVPLGIHAGKMIDQVRFQSGQNEATFVAYSVEFKLNENGPVDPIVPPADGTLCTPNQWEVIVFNNVDFRQYAGATVKITAEAMRCGGSTAPKAQRQFNDSSYTQVEQNSYIDIGTEWTDFGVESFTVPAGWASAAKAINYGIRTVPNENYSECLIYYRNFNVEVLEAAEDPSQNASSIIYNFEENANMVSGNGATAEKVASSKTGNKAWKQVSAGGYAAGTIATKLPDGKTLDEMASVRFDYYIVTEGVQYKPVKVLIGAELENAEDVWNNAYVNTPDTGSCQDMTNGQTWGTCTTALDAEKISALGLAAGANIKLGIGMMWEGATYYIDNVRLVDAEGTEYLLEDFESTAPTFGVVNYGVESSVIDTVDLSAYGNSIVQVTNSSWGQGIKFSFTLPEGKTIADYKGLQMNVFLPADVVLVQNQDFTYKEFRVAAGTGDYVALPEGTEYVGWNTGGSVGSWALVDISNWDTLAAAIGDATTFNIAVGVNTPCANPYFIDNVMLVAR